MDNAVCTGRTNRGRVRQDGRSVHHAPRLSIGPHGEKRHIRRAAPDDFERGLVDCQKPAFERTDKILVACRQNRSGRKGYGVLKFLDAQGLSRREIDFADVPVARDDGLAARYQRVGAGEPPRLSVEPPKTNVGDVL